MVEFFPIMYTLWERIACHVIISLIVVLVLNHKAFEYCEEFQATPGYSLCCNVIVMELFSGLEDKLASITCIADKLLCNGDVNSVLKEEVDGTVGLQ